MSETTIAPDDALLPFVSPPVWEVSLSVMTEPGMLSEYDVRGFHEMLGPAYGIATRVPGLDSLDPLPRTGPLASTPVVNFTTQALPDRWWFSSADGTMLVQAQANLLALNWRRSLDSKGSSSVNYPGFQAMLAEFRSILELVRNWHSKHRHSTPEPTTCSLLYTNFISLENNDGDRMKIGDVYSRFLGDGVPMFGWKTSWAESIDSCTRPDASSLAIEVLTGAAALPASAETWPIVKMQFDSRCPVSTWEEAFSFLTSAHDLTAERFVSLTTEKARAMWNTK